MLNKIEDLFCDHPIAFVTLCLPIVALLVVGAQLLFVNPTKTEVIFTVNDKERVSYNDVGSYLIYTSDEVFKNSDDWRVGKFNSSDLYGQLEVGKTYQCKVYGWRVPFLSWYRNIYDCKEASEP